MTKIKFPMHGAHRRQTIRIVYTALGLTMTTGFLYYFLQTLPLEAAYKNFYATYDPIASFNRMMEGGYISSCPPPPSKGDGKSKEQKK